MKFFLRFLLIFCIFYKINATSSEEEINFQVQKFKDILTTIKENYKDSVDFKEISDVAFKAMISNLDKQSLYFNILEYKSLKNANNAQVTGVGIVPVIIFNKPYIYSVVKNSPADSLNMNPMDEIISINQDPLLAKSINDLNNLLNGEINSKVNIKIKKHSTGNIFEYNLTRTAINFSSVEASFLVKDKIGFIKLNRFTSRCDNDFEDSLVCLMNNKIKCLIVDLRGNPGGYLDQVANILNHFIEKDAYILKSKASNPKYNVEKRASKQGEYMNLPIIAIIDENSASASEIFSGFIQDYDLGLVVGDRSFGKGSVQNTWEFKDSTAFRLTVAEYLTPSGREIQKNYNRESIKIDLSLKLSIGDSLYNNLQKALGEFGGANQLPIYKSKKGRTIIGGGGVFPDYYIKDDSTTLLFQVINNQRLNIEFIFDYIAKNEKELGKYKNFINFEEDFKLSDSTLVTFKNFCLSKNVWNEEMFIKDKEKIANNLKSIIAEYYWKLNGYYYVFLNSDKQFLKALSLVEEAIKIKNQK